MGREAYTYKDSCGALLKKHHRKANIHSIYIIITSFLHYILNTTIRHPSNNRQHAVLHCRLRCCARRHRFGRQCTIQRYFISLPNCQRNWRCPPYFYIAAALHWCCEREHWFGSWPHCCWRCCSGKFCSIVPSRVFTNIPLDALGGSISTLQPASTFAIIPF